MLKILGEIINEKKGISDFFITEGMKLGVRIDGEVHNKINYNGEALKFSLSQIKEVLSPQLSKKNKTFLDFEKEKSLDAKIVFSGHTARLNFSYTSGRISLVMRILPQKNLKIDDLGIDTKFLSKILGAKKGLFLVGGITGSGKSSTMGAIIDYYNSTRNSHIITLEDPVEASFDNNKCIISQKELGVDFNSWDEGLINAMRQDPDIIMLGEIRDKETLDLALSLAGTGHLVVGTIHGPGASGIIGKIVRQYDNEKEILGVLAESLIGIIYQKLVKGKNGRKYPCIETLYVNDQVSSGFLNGKYSLLNSIIQTGSSDGMIRLDQYLNNELQAKGLLEQSEYNKLIKNLYE